MKKNLILTLYVSLLGTTFAIAQTKVEFKTTMGNITIELFDDTPKHKANMIKLVKERFYDNILFHRVIPEFMIQAGDPDSKNASATEYLGHGNVKYTIAPEMNKKYVHVKGAVAAARIGDHANPEKRSSGSQFYIVEGRSVNPETLNPLYMPHTFEYTEEHKSQYSKFGGTPHLDGEYTIFAKVIEGMEVIEKISNAPRNEQDRPLKDIKIIEAKIVK